MPKKITTYATTFLMGIFYLFSTPLNVMASTSTFIYENEVGDTPYTATPILMSSTVLGRINESTQDIDYYSLDLDQDMDLSISLSSLNPNTIQYYNLELLASDLTPIAQVEHVYDFGFFGKSQINVSLEKGHYFIKVSSNNTPVTVNQNYSLSLSEAVPYPEESDLIQKVDIPDYIEGYVTSEDVINHISSTDSRMQQNYEWYMHWSDSLSIDLSQYDSTLVPFQYHLPQINVFEAWEETTGSPEIIVAIIDQGIDYSNPALRNNTLPVVNTYDSSITTPAKMQHGTHTTGILGANLTTGTGVSGIAPGITIMPIDAWDETGHTRTEQSTADAIIYAVDNGARVISMSLGPVGDDITADNPIIHEAVQYAYANDVVLIASGGNHGANELYAPASYPEVISVGAVNGNDELWEYSNTGSDIVAPGENIYSLSTDNGLLLMSGTSMSAPMVAGTAGLILSKNPDLTNEEVRDILLSSADSIGDESLYGHGRLNVGQALKLTPETDNSTSLLPTDRWYSNTIMDMYNTNLIHHSWISPLKMDELMTWKDLKIVMDHFFVLPSDDIIHYNQTASTNPITRIDFLNTLYDLKDYLMGYSLEEEHLDSTEFFVTNGIIQGRGDGELAYEEYITWAEALTILNNFHNFRVQLSI